MLRKILIFFTILLIAFLSYFSYKLLKEKEVAVNSLIDAVPFDASVIIEINKPGQLFDIVFSPPADAESFFNIPFIKEPVEKLKMIDSLALNEKIIRSALRRPYSALISGHPVGKDELEMVYYFKLNSEKEFLLAEKIIRQSVKAKGNISYHQYEDARINDVTIFNRKSEGFSYAYHRGMFILSKSSILVEEVIRQSGSNTTIRSKAGLETVLRTAGKSSLFNVYINFDYFPVLALNFIHSRFKSELDAISRFARWIELDCNIQNNAIVLNGFSTAENTNGFFSDIFEGQEPFNLTLPGLLPSSTRSFLSLGISNYPVFRENFSGYQKKNLTTPDFDRNLKVFRQSTGIDLETEFQKVFDQEVCFAYYPGTSESLPLNVFTVIKTKGSNEAKQFLNQVSEGPLSQRTDTATQNMTVYNTSTHNFPRLLFGNIFGMNKNSFCTLSENYLIFSDSVAHLAAFAREFSQMKNFSLDVQYRNLSGLLSEDAYCYFYLSPEAEQLYTHYMKYTSEQMLKQYRYGLSQVQAIVYQFGRNNNLFYNNAFVKFTPKPSGNVNKQWEITLDDVPATPISPVKNHTNNKNEIILQDQSGNLYLISDKGEILWKRKLNGNIQGNIAQADLFNNKKLQYVFNTETHILAIDRNGKDVEGFPVKLGMKATAGMAVFDYDKNRNYRFVVPLADNRLYCFDRTGKEVEGWAKPEVGNKPSRAMYFNSNGKDFIVTYDENEIHFFDRRGRLRIAPERKIKVASNSGVFANTGKNGYQFECTDSTGAIHLISLTGNVTRVQTGIYPANHYYLSADIDFNRQNDHIFFHGRKLEAFSATGSRIVNYPLNGEISKTPKIIPVSDSTFLFTYTDAFSANIYLKNHLGSSLENTPLKGNSEVVFQLEENSGKGVNIYYANNNILTCIFVK